VRSQVRLRRGRRPPNWRPPYIELVGSPGHGEQAARVMEWQAEVCARMGSPFYAGLLPLIAADLCRGGPALDVLAGYLSASTGAFPLRLLGAVHALVLTGQAPDLAACYPSAGAAPGAREADAWPAFRRVLAE
jgi:hypothetical protein